MGWRQRVFDRFFSDLINARVSAAVKVIDDRWWEQMAGFGGPQDRDWWEIKEGLDAVLEAWRKNPLAFRITALTSDYVVGRGLEIVSETTWVNEWIKAFWKHPKNRLNSRLYSWCDELTRTGEVFIVLFTNPADGMSYLRELPAIVIDKIETDPEDLEREIRYHQINVGDFSVGGKWWDGSPVHGKGGVIGPEVLHFAINKPVGCVRGQGDLTAIIPWLRRYKEWLEDRVRVNRYKSAFLWHVTVKGGKAPDIAAKKTQYLKPPPPASIIVTDENEKWEAIQANIMAEDVEADGKALRLIIGAGAGVPLHFLAEGETATRATAKEMGGPTVRHYEHRQLYFCEMLMRVVTRALDRAVSLGKVPQARGGWKLSYVVQDMTEEDNLLLAQAAHHIVDALVIAVEQEWCSKKTAMQMFYKFAGMGVDISELEAQLKEAGTKE